MHEPNARTEVQKVCSNTSDVETVTPPDGTRMCLISVEGSDARISMVGTSPDSTHGHVFPAGTAPVTVFGRTPFKCASVDSSAATINVTFLS